MNTVDSPSKLTLAFGDYGMGVTGGNHAYLFSYDKQGLESLRVDGKEWLYRVPRPIFWRATTENDRGAGFPQKVAPWYGASQFVTGQALTMAVDGQQQELPLGTAANRYGGDVAADTFAITYRYTLPLVSAAYCDVTYTVAADASLTVSVAYPGFSGLPELPVFGLQLIMPTPASGFVYTGLSGETYPDRLNGGVPGTYRISGLPVTPYLVPQDCGVHMQTTAVTITRERTRNNVDQAPSPFSLQVTAAEAPFAFSCLPYTAFELENATHQDELPPQRRTVLTVMGAVRGVGGIDSWGSDVTAPYHIDSAAPHQFSFTLA